MKNLIMLLIVGLMFTSCKKDQDGVAVQTVTYQVECLKCIVEFEDADFNHTVERESARYKSVVVSGKFKYDFNNVNGLKEVSLRIHSPVFVGNQLVVASISTGKKNKVTINEEFGYIDYQTQVSEKTITLNLN